MEYNRFDVKYFDGLTSLPKAALIQIHLQQQLLYIQFEDASIQQLNFAAIVVQDGPNHLQIRDCSNMAAYFELEVDAKQRKYLLNVLAKKNVHLQFKQLGIFKILLIAVLLFTALITTYFLVLPPLAEKTVEILPTSVDDHIGDTFFNAVVDVNLVDEKRTFALNAFAHKLNLHNKRPLHFNVVHSSEVNAFAMPNGEIVIYTGLLDQLQSSAQLVALLGHEVSHVNERHSMKLLSRNLAGYMVISLILGDVSGITAVLADNAQQLHQLSYARGHEQEADELGLQILLDNHQDPQAMLQLFQKLKAHGSEEIPELLSSHPLPQSRIQYIQKRILQQKSLVVQNPDLEKWFKRLQK